VVVERKRTTYGAERLGALSDGIFAIVLTLLVLELKFGEVPEHREDLTGEFRNHWPEFLAWGISFVVIARFWMVHHTILAALHRCHLGTIGLNFVFLATISLLPFGASVLGDYEFDHFGPIALAGGVLGAAGMALGLLARHAFHERDLRHPDAADETWHGKLAWHWKYHSVVIPLVAIACVGVAGIYPHIALALWAGEFAVAYVAGLLRD
jgi:uncharacterized membrane protein